MLRQVCGFSVALLDCAVRAAVPTGGLRGAAAWVNKELPFINEAAVRSSEISIALLSQAKKYLIL